MAPPATCWRSWSPALPGEHIVLNGTIDGTLSGASPGSRRCRRIWQQLIAAVRGTARDIGIAFDGDADRIGLVDDTGDILFGDQLMVMLARDVLTRASWRHHHRRREGQPGAVRRDRARRRHAADVEDRPQPDQGEDGGDRLARWPARCPATSSSPTAGTVSTTRCMPRCACWASSRAWTASCRRCARRCRR